MNQMEKNKNKNNNNSSNSLIFGRWPQTKTRAQISSNPKLRISNPLERLASFFYIDYKIDISESPDLQESGEVAVVEVLEEPVDVELWINFWHVDVELRPQAFREAQVILLQNLGTSQTITFPLMWYSGCSKLTKLIK